ILRSRGPHPSAAARLMDEAATTLSRNSHGRDRGGMRLLLDRQAGTRGLVVALIALAVLTALLIWYGFSQRREASDGWVITPLSALVVGIAMWQVPAHPIVGTRVAGAEPWSEARVASYVEQR